MHKTQRRARLRSDCGVHESRDSCSARGVVDGDEPGPLLDREGRATERTRAEGEPARFDLRVEAVEVEVAYDYRHSCGRHILVSVERYFIHECVWGGREPGGDFPNFYLGTPNNQDFN